MSFMDIVILGIVGYLAFYSIVERVCKCCENCATTKAFGKFVDVNKDKENKDA